MTHTYTIEYSEEENRAMEMTHEDVDGWLQGTAHDRAREAMREVVMREVQRRIAADEPIPATRAEILDAADATLFESKARVNESSEDLSTRVPLKP